LKKLRGEAPTKKVPTNYVREDIMEPLNTTPGARYYQDEFGTYYREGVPREFGNSSGFTPGRSAVYDNAGNFTGKVNVFSTADKDVPVET
jgi:hypothetical protein